MIHNHTAIFTGPLVDDNSVEDRLAMVDDDDFVVDDDDFVVDGDDVVQRSRRWLRVWFYLV